MATDPRTVFNFTKLLGDDLEKTATFYRDVCGLTEQQRVNVSLLDRPTSQVVFNTAHPGAPTLVLLKYLDGPMPKSDEVILGFLTNNADDFMERVKAAGGSVRMTPGAQPGGPKVGFATDIEGHLIEVMELL